MRKTYKKAFSLIELLVSMAIIAVLIGLVGFGVATAQRNARDNQRQQKVADIRVGLTDYLTKHNEYPHVSDDINITSDEIILGPDDTNPIVIQLDGPTEASSETGPSGAQYCYGLREDDGGYILGVKLENGEWFDQSSTISGEKACSDTNTGDLTMP
jgi:prepilin-type N-terminal cleavage/methylation domain-containing protein